MTAYYNEHNPYAAKWLRNLIAAGHIAPGDVDERDIQDVLPSDLSGYTQCHFFAGIGVWSYALRKAGWPDDRPVWTGSCPCQPFSQAGDGLAFADERHLWPAFFHLIEKRRPPEVFGEQVASKDADLWIDLVQDDLEGLGYAVGAVPFPAAGIGAPNIRDRLYWLANSSPTRFQIGSGYQGKQTAPERGRDANAGGGELSGLADAKQHHCGRETSTSDHFRQEADRPANRIGRRGGAPVPRPGPINGFWRSADWLCCRDGKWRPVEPGTFPLAHGVAQRVGRLRAYGNAINAEAAEAFVRAYLGS